MRKQILYAILSSIWQGRKKNAANKKGSTPVLAGLLDLRKQQQGKGFIYSYGRMNEYSYDKLNESYQ